MTQTQVIERGTQGEAVKEIQQVLNRMGYGLGSAGVDGKFGPKTEAAVRQFQSDMNQQFPEANVLVDGRVGHQTLFFLKKSRS